MITFTNTSKAAKLTGLPCWLGGMFVSSVSHIQGLDLESYRPFNVQALIDNTEGGFLM